MKSTRGGARPNSGRPRMYDELTRIAVSMDEEDKRRLDAFARKKKVNRSQAVVMLIRRLK